MSVERKKRGKGWQPRLSINWNLVRGDLKKTRLEKGITVRKLEELVGISFASISKMELGKSKFSADALVTIIDFLDKNIDDYIIKSQIEIYNLK